MGQGLELGLGIEPDKEVVAGLGPGLGTGLGTESDKDVVVAGRGAGLGLWLDAEEVPGKVLGLGLLLGIAPTG